MNDAAVVNPHEGNTSAVEDIIVTAQRRAENLQVVPISITALSAKTLEAARVVDVRGLSALAPNLSVRVLGGGNASPGYVTRGIATFGTQAGADKGVSLYLDGVYIQSQSGSIFSVADIDRIEVLKGPQGTLFGRNATGGAISITTRDPVGKAGFVQEVTAGNYGQFRSRSRIDLPQLGPISAYVSYVHSQRQGDIRNTGAGTSWNYAPSTGGDVGIRRSPKYLGSENNDAIFFAAKLDLAPGLHVKYKFDYSTSDYTPDGQGVLNIFPAAAGPAAGLISATLAFQPGGAVNPINFKRPDAVNNAFTTPSSTRVQGHNITTEYTISNNVKLKDILAYRKVYSENTFQLDGLGGLVNIIPQLGPVGAPFAFLVNTSKTSGKQWSNEVQLNIDTKPFSMTVGYLHFDFRENSGGFEGPPNVFQFTAFPNYVIPSQVPNNIPTRFLLKSDAVYAQPEIHLSNNLDIVGGYRITRDVKTGTDNTVLSTLGVQAFSYRKTKPTFLVGVNFRPQPGILTYAKYSTGFISGGSLASVSYQEETAKSAEVGVKADLFDRRLRTNLALFNVKYRNLQFPVFGLTLSPPINAAQVLVNGADATARGFEFETTAVPVDGLTLNGGLGYTDFKYDRFNPILATFGNFVVYRRPKWTGNAAVQYETPEVWRGGHLQLRLDATYHSGFDGVGTYPTEEYRKATFVPSTWIANGRLALVDFDLANARGQVAFWGRNLFDNRNPSEVTVLSFVNSVSYERARTFGVDLRVAY